LPLINASEDYQNSVNVSKISSPFVMKVTDNFLKVGEYVCDQVVEVARRMNEKPVASSSTPAGTPSSTPPTETPSPAAPTVTPTVAALKKDAASPTNGSSTQTKPANDSSK
jgi:predicted RNA-binding protein with RPS1 domain